MKTTGIIQYDADLVLYKTEPLFDTGQIVVTQNLWDTVSDKLIEVDCFKGFAQMINDHQHGVWGRLDDEDWNANMRAVRDGARILSVYEIEGIKVWCITEADRSVTTLLLPEDY